MTKSEALAKFDGSVRVMAAVLGITEQAIHQWGDNVPELRVFQIETLAKEYAERRGS